MSAGLSGVRNSLCLDSALENKCEAGMFRSRQARALATLAERTVGMLDSTDDPKITTAYCRFDI